MMKILVFGDIHRDLSAINQIKKKSKDCDLILCAGDLSNFGVGLKKTMLELDKINIPIFIVHGNHEDLETIKEIKTNNIKLVHKKLIKFKDYFITGYGDLGFSERSVDAENFIEKIKTRLKNEKVLFITHAPPKNTRLDFLPGIGHVGCKSFRKAIDIIKPKIYVCGHLHENFNIKQKIDSTLIINPGPKGIIIEIN